MIPASPLFARCAVNNVVRQIALWRRRGLGVAAAGMRPTSARVANSAPGCAHETLMLLRRDLRRGLHGAEWNLRAEPLSASRFECRPPNSVAFAVLRIDAMKSAVVRMSASAGGSVTIGNAAAIFIDVLPTQPTIRSAGVSCSCADGRTARRGRILARLREKLL